MYIEERIYSEGEQEIYYSVILDETEMRLFSEFQKEFFSPTEVISDIARSGVKRTYKKYGGRARKKIASKIAKKHGEEVDKYLRNLEREDIINKELAQNKELTRGIREDIKKTDPIIEFNVKRGVDSSAGNVYYGNEAKNVEKTTTKAIVEGKMKPLSAFKSFLKYSERKSKGRINFDPGDSSAVLLHEYNHIKNSRGKNGFRNRIINSMDNRKKKRNGLNFFKSLIQNKEEWNASKGALKDLEKYGITDHERRLAKLSLGSAYKTYEYGNKADFLHNLYKKIQIKSRKPSDDILKKIEA